MEEAAELGNYLPLSLAESHKFCANPLDNSRSVLLGLNYTDYLREAQRTLKFGGWLKIAETIERWKDKREGLLRQITELGLVLVGSVTESNQFFYVSAIKT